jgi:leucine-rich repeat protein SHOC2
MRRSALFVLIAVLLNGCAPSDQFWKRPDVGQKITTIDDAMKQPGTVRNLDLFNRNLPAFPREVLKLPRLERLSLRRNTIGELPDAIGALSALTWLDLGECGLTTPPVAVGKLRNLAFLYLNDNALAELPAVVGDLSKLKYLNADRNRLAAIPASLCGLPELRWLRLNSNQITALPANLAPLSKNLQRLYLRDNPIPDPEKERIRKALPNCMVVF